MKIRSYKEYKSNGFSLKYYTRIINDYGVQRTIVIAYCDGRRMKDFAGEEKYALRSIICRLVDEQRAAETEAYIKEQAARMGVSEYIVKAHIEEVERKNMKATVLAEKPEITAEDIALYDYALGGAPVEGYTITCAETILKSMKKAGITPAAVERARKKINKEKKAAAPAPVVEAPAPAEDFTPHIEENGDLHYENYTVKGPDGNAVVFGSYIPAGLLEPAPADELVQPSKELIEDMKQIAVDDEAAETLAAIKTNAADGVSGIVLDGVESLVRPEVLQAEVEKIETKLKEDTTPTSEKTDTPTVKKFEVGKSYYCRSFCDYDCIFTIDIIERKGNKITLKSWDNSIRKKIVKVDNDGVEWFRYDRYSMAPIYRANKETAPEEVIKKEVETTTAADDPAAVDAHFADLADHAPASEKTEPEPTEQKTAPTDAEVMETAARIRANYEAMQADIEAEREQAAAAFAEAITAYCEGLSRPEPLAWEPETIIIPFEPRPAAEVEQPRRRHRLNLRPRLSRWLHPVRWVAVAFVVCLLSGLLLGMNTSTAADAAADDIAAAYDLDPVTVTAEAPDTFIEDKAPCLIEDKAPAPSPVKKLAAPSPVKNVADAAECSSQKTASDIATATAPADDDADSLTTAPAAPLAPAADADGLTICAGTAWAYTMMNWA